MITMMPISHQNAFVLARNHNNWAWGTIQNPWILLPPMQMDGISPAGALTVSEFKVQRLVITGPNITVDGSESISTGVIEWARGSDSDTFYYRAIERQTISLNTGPFRYYVKLSDDSEYISEPFYFYNCGAGEPPATGTGDYLVTDYNDDYYK